MKSIRGIALLALAIVIVLLLILAGATIGVLTDSGILKNAEGTVDMSKVDKVKSNIEVAISRKMTSTNREITMEQIIEQLENKNIIDQGDSNVETGQIKTKKDGYVYEIKEKANG